MKILQITAILILIQGYLVGMHKAENLQAAKPETKTIRRIENNSKEDVTVTFVRETPLLLQTYRSAAPHVQEEVLDTIESGDDVQLNRPLTLLPGDKGEIIVIYGGKALPHETLFGHGPLARQARMSWDQLEGSGDLIINDEGISYASAKLS